MRSRLAAAAVAALTLVVAVVFMPANLKPVALLLRDLESSDARRVSVARDELVKRAEPRVVPILVRSLEVRDGMAAPNAIRALAAMGDVALPFLLDALSSDNPDVRAHAANALGVNGDRRALASLQRALSDEDGRVRRIAVMALAGVRDPQALDLVRQVLDGTDSEMAYFAALALGRDRHDVSAVPGIVRLFDVVEQPAQKAELVKALKATETAESVAFLAARLTTEPSAYVRMEMASVLGASSDPSVGAALETSAGARQLEVVAAAYTYYMRTDPEAHEALLVEAFQRYGGSAMATAFRNSGRAAFVRAAANDHGRQKYIAVQ